jgi:hypothetical protein
MTASSRVSEHVPPLDPETAQAPGSVSTATLSQMLRARGINATGLPRLVGDRAALRGDQPGARDLVMYEHARRIFNMPI